MPVIGILGSGSPGPNAENLAAFRQGLSETGYVEGQNVAIEYRRPTTMTLRRAVFLSPDRRKIKVAHDAA